MLGASRNLGERGSRVKRSVHRIAAICARFLLGPPAGARVGSRRAPLRRVQRRGRGTRPRRSSSRSLGVGDNEDALTNGQALVLGLVQGLTELLPISSSGHLILVPWAAEWTYLEENDRFNQTFDVALHLGTLVAVAAYFWRDFVRLLRALFASLGRRRVETPDERIAWFVVVATIPAGLVGPPRRRLDRRQPRRAVADPRAAGRRRASPAVGRSLAADAGDGRSRDASRDRHGARTGTRARAGSLALGHHDHGRPLHEPRSRQRCAVLLLPPAADDARRGAPQGRGGRPARRPTRGLDRPVPRRNARRARQRASWRSSGSSATCAATRTASSSSTASSWPRSSCSRS